MKTLNSKLDGYVFEYKEPIPERNEQTIEVIKTYCVHWGCGKQLNLFESLCGDKCIDHAGIKPMKFSNGLL